MSFLEKVSHLLGKAKGAGNSALNDLKSAATAASTGDVGSAVEHLKRGKTNALEHAGSIVGHDNVKSALSNPLASVKHAVSSMKDPSALLGLAKHGIQSVANANQSSPEEEEEAERGAEESGGEEEPSKGGSLIGNVLSIANQAKNLASHPGPSAFGKLLDALPLTGKAAKYAEYAKGALNTADRARDFLNNPGLSSITALAKTVHFPVDPKKVAAAIKNEHEGAQVKKQKNAKKAAPPAAKKKPPPKKQQKAKKKKH